MNRTGWCWLLTVGLGLAAPVVASAAQVDVVLGPSLAGTVSRIDQVERRNEQEFREHRAYEGLDKRSERAVSADSVLSQVEWANEALIPDAGQYGLESLIRALVTESLARAGMQSYDKTLRVTLNELGVTNHSVAPLRSASNFATGRVEEIDPATGKSLRAVDVVSNLVVNSTADRSYAGRDFAFDDTDPSRRVGPSVAYFVTSGLRQLFPDQTFPKVVTVLFGDRDPDDFPRPRLVRVR